MGEIDKLTLPLHGLPLLVQTIQPFLGYARTGYIIVAVNPERVEEFQTLFKEHFPDNHSRIAVTAGGRHRQESILKALRVLDKQPHLAPQDPVMIHDGARPFVTAELFDSLIQALSDHDGVIPALPVRDTIKRVHGSDVLGTEDRECLRLVQTPQVFRFTSILGLHERAETEAFIGTDDASLLEQYEGRVGWVDGPTYNLKITLPEDIALLSYLFAQSQSKQDG